MEYYSVLKRNGILIHATIWLNLKYIMLCKISQTQNKEYCITSLI